MRTHLICGFLFTGLSDCAETDQTVVFEGDSVAFVGPSAHAPEPAPGDEVLDYSDDFVMPGLIDIHVHLTYGNAQANEDIDMYAPPEYRALRALHAAQQVLKAGYTSIADPASTGRGSAAVRDAINAGLFQGPRITTSGRQITSRQGLGDWYPSWIGAPESSIGVLVRSIDEAIGPACGLEMVHAASLILDDLPVMDNATLRRGAPANHKLFGEATAILAAIGLLNRAFGAMAEDPKLSAAQKVQLAAILSRSVGSEGLVAGQEQDLKWDGAAARTTKPRRQPAFVGVP